MLQLSWYHIPKDLTSDNIVKPIVRGVDFASYRDEIIPEVARRLIKLSRII